MIFKIFSSYDEKTEAFLPPFYLPTIEAAKRHFGDAVNNPETSIHLHPGDYSLFSLGTFDDETGEIIYNKKILGNGIDFKTPRTPEELVDDFKMQAVES